MNFKIVSDSSCDLLTFEGVDFDTVPMKVSTDKKEYIDDRQLNIDQMLTDLKNHKGRSFTACPNTSEWLKAFDGADNVFAVTITSALSGSFNSASAAKEIAEKENSDKHIYVIDTLSAGPEMLMIIEKLKSMISSGYSFNLIKESIIEYQNHTHLLFSLESMHNFVQNGRVSRVAALAAGTLGIRVVGMASNKGTLEMVGKQRGEAKTIMRLVEEMEKRGYAGKKVRIGHTQNENGAATLKEKMLEKYPAADVIFYPMRGLCSYYAEIGGILVGFEG